MFGCGSYLVEGHKVMFCKILLSLRYILLNIYIKILKNIFFLLVLCGCDTWSPKWRDECV